MYLPLRRCLLYYFCQNSSKNTNISIVFNYLTHNHYEIIGFCWNFILCYDFNGCISLYFWIYIQLWLPMVFYSTYIVSYFNVRWNSNVLQIIFLLNSRIGLWIPMRVNTNLHLMFSTLVMNKLWFYYIIIIYPSLYIWRFKYYSLNLIKI